MNAVSDFDLLTNLDQSAYREPCARDSGRRFPRPAERSSGQPASMRTSAAAGSGSVCGPALRQRPWIQPRIDTNRYRILTFEFGVPDTPRDILHGSIARIVWRVNGESAENVSDDIIFSSRSGANVLNKVIVDMADWNSLSLERRFPQRLDQRVDQQSPGSTSSASTRTNSIGRRTSSSSASSWRRLKRQARRTRFAGPSANRAARSDLYWDDDASGFDGTLIQNNINASSGQLQLGREQHRDLDAHELLHLRDFPRRRRSGEQYQPCLRQVADRHRQHLSAAASSRAQPADAELRSRRPEQDYGTPNRPRHRRRRGSPCWTVDNTGSFDGLPR